MQKITIFILSLLLISNICYAQKETRWVNIGEGIYELGFIFPYKIKLSVPYGARNIGEIKEGLIPLKFDLLWLPNKSNKKYVVKVFSKQFKNSYKTPEGYNLAKNSIYQFTKKLPAVNRHDKWTFIYYPDVGTKLFIEDKKIYHVVGAKFNRTLIQSWINKDRVLTANLFNRLLKLQ